MDGQEGSCAGEGELGQRRGMTGGDHLSVRERGIPVPVRDGAMLGLGPLLGLDRKASPRPYSIFLCPFISLFCFSISFITFSILVQIDSNEFLKFSEIQGNELGQ
jgi:hypothetical protein